MRKQVKEERNEGGDCIRKEPVQCGEQFERCNLRYGCQVIVVEISACAGSRMSQLRAIQLTPASLGLSNPVLQLTDSYTYRHKIFPHAHSLSHLRHSFSAPHTRTPFTHNPRSLPSRMASHLLRTRSITHQPPSKTPIRPQLG